MFRILNLMLLIVGVISEYPPNLQNKFEKDIHEILNTYGISRTRLKTVKKDKYHTWVPDVIKRNGYPVEVYEVETEDGYIVETHRIPYGKKCGLGKNKRAVLLQHGILGSSADWVVTGPNKGLGYILADHCYDVWLTNCRGNTYSRDHIAYTSDVADYWNFSWHEMGVYDLPAFIDFILEKTGLKQIYHIGFSLGNTCFYVMCSERPKYNKKIKAQISLAPLVYLKHATNSIIKMLATYNLQLEIMTKALDIHEVLPKSDLITAMEKLFCSEEYYNHFFCSNIQAQLSGFNLENLDPKVLSAVINHYPAGTSTKTILHFAQLAHSDIFRQYNYGPLLNYIHYDHMSPPKYNLKNVKVPVSLFYSRGDVLSSGGDIKRLYHELGNPVDLYSVHSNNFTHIEFMWGKNSKNLVYKKLLQILKKNY